MDKTIDEIRALLGKNVRIVLDAEAGVVSEGKFLEFDDGGSFTLVDDMGFKHYGWPMLEIDPV